MERRNNYSGMWKVVTSAARIAIAKNNRETLSLARTSKELSSESDCAVKSFYKEKAKANSFLQEVYDHSKKNLSLKANWDENECGNVELKKENNLQRFRLPSLDINQMEKSQRRLQELLSRGDTSDAQSQSNEMGSLKERNNGNEFKDNTVGQLKKKNRGNELKEVGQLQERNSANKHKVNTVAHLKGKNTENELTKDRVGDLKKRNNKNELEENNLEKMSLEDSDASVSNAKKPFKVRAGTSSICFSCYHFHRKNSPSAYGSNMERKWSDELRLNDSSKTSKNKVRKLSLPMIRRMSLDQNRTNDVHNPYLPIAGCEAHMHVSTNKKAQ